MILDFEETSVPNEFSADIVIVGAGAVGLSMYADLLRKGKDVLLLEGGGASLDMRSQDILRQATNTGFVLEGLHSGRYRYLGGTTNFWGGQLVEFDNTVFEPRDWMGSKGWPIMREEIAPYYRKAMSLLGMDKSIQTDEDVWSKTRTQPPSSSFDVEYFFTRWVKTTNFARFFERDINNPKGRVLLNANVIGFSKSDVLGDDPSLVIRTFSGRTGTVRGKKIVLACGTIETARLLLLPYTDGSETPWAENTWLGRAYIDHLDLNVGDVTPINHKRFAELFENIFIDGYKYNPKLKLSENAQKRLSFVGVAGSFIYTSSLKEHAENIKIFLRSLSSGRRPENLTKLPAHAFALAKVALPLIFRYFWSNRMFHPKGSNIFFRVTTEQVPLRESRITLKDEKDSLGMPKINVNWSIDGREIDAVAHFAECVKEHLEHEDIANLKLNSLLLARDREFLKQGDDTNHQMGACRMANDEEDGVVDVNCKVFGASAIYVGGSAVMPSTGFANCTLTAISLGLRLSEYLETH